MTGAMGTWLDFIGDWLVPDVVEAEWEVVTVTVLTELVDGRTGGEIVEVTALDEDELLDPVTVMKSRSNHASPL